MLSGANRTPHSQAAQQQQSPAPLSRLGSVHVATAGTPADRQQQMQTANAASGGQHGSHQPIMSQHAQGMAVQGSCNAPHWQRSKQ